MIVVAISGGLGNQMFQYAFYKNLIFLGKNVKVDILSTWNKKTGLHNGYELNNIFKLNVDILNTVERKNFLGFTGDNYFIFSVKEKLNLLKKCHFIRKPKNAIYYNQDLFSLENKYIVGYFQSEKYFKSIQEIIKKEFTFSDFQDKENIKLLHEIRNTNSVSVHIRRSDYLNNKYLSNVATLKYYKNAITFIKEKISDPTFFIFSDDIAWCKQNFGLEKQYFVSNNIGSNSYRDMQLMSCCKHNIIANSSFSWWGAWLNNNINKIVMTPNQWFNIVDGTRDIIPDNWYKIDIC